MEEYPDLDGTFDFVDTFLSYERAPEPESGCFYRHREQGTYELIDSNPDSQDENQTYAKEIRTIHSRFWGGWIKPCAIGKESSEFGLSEESTEFGAPIGWENLDVSMLPFLDSVLIEPQEFGYQVATMKFKKKFKFGHLLTVICPTEFAYARYLPKVDMVEYLTRCFREGTMAPCQFVLDGYKDGVVFHVATWNRFVFGFAEQGSRCFHAPCKADFEQAAKLYLANKRVDLSIHFNSSENCDMGSRASTADYFAFQRIVENIVGTLKNGRRVIRYLKDSGVSMSTAEEMEILFTNYNLLQQMAGIPEIDQIDIRTADISSSLKYGFSFIRTNYGDGFLGNAVSFLDKVFASVMWNLYQSVAVSIKKISNMVQSYLFNRSQYEILRSNAHFTMHLNKVRNFLSVGSVIEKLNGGMINLVRMFAQVGVDYQIKPFETILKWSILTAAIPLLPGLVIGSAISWVTLKYLFKFLHWCAGRSENEVARMIYRVHMHLNGGIEPLCIIFQC
nr:hypothetical protein [Rhizoctonia solani fusarivirus 5]